MKTALNMPKALIFDWDDTLFDGHALYHDVFAHILNEFAQQGIEPNPTLYTRETFDFDTHRMATNKDGKPIYATTADFWDAAYGKEVGPLAMNRMSQIIRSKHELASLGINLTEKILPGARELLTWLNAHHIPFAIASNSQNDVLRFFVEESLGNICRNTITIGRTIEDTESIKGTSPVMLEKPAPDMLLYAMDRLGVTKSDMIYHIGDDIKKDGGAALNAGITAIILGTEVHKSTLSIRNLSDLQKSLEQARMQQISGSFRG